MRSFFEELLELFRQLRHDLEEVADDAVVGDLEDRRLGVLVDGHDHLRRAHAGQVLDRARDAEAHIELGRDRPAGLADLEPVRAPARVHRRARGAHRGADHARHVLEDHVVLRPLHAAAARQHDLGLGQLGEPRGDLFAPLDEPHLRDGGHAAFSRSKSLSAPHSASCLSPASVALSVNHTASAWPLERRAASPMTSAITFFGVPCRSSSTMHQNAFAMVLPPSQIALASSRSERTSSFTAVGTSPGMMRPGGRGGSASSVTTESWGGSAAHPRSAALTARISFFFAPMMPFSVGYRGSLSPFCAVRIAGNGRSKTSSPPSTWRAARTVLPSPSIVSSMIQEAHGQPSSSASWAATAPMSSSIACRPQRTSCGASCLSTAASAFAVASVSAAFHAGSFRWIARSQPIARHERSASFTRSGPRDTATTRSEEHTSELQSQSNLVCRLLLEKKKKRDTELSYYRAYNIVHKDQINILHNVSNETEVRLSNRNMIIYIHP